MFTRPSVVNLGCDPFFSVRWSVPVPLGECNVLQCDETRSRSKGVPHLLIQDDVYNGYSLPGGSSVFFNVWLVISHTTGLRPSLTICAGQ